MHAELKENTTLESKYLPFNIFYNTPDSENILYTHWHDNIEIIYMVEGTAVFYAGNEVYSAGPGEIVFVNKGLLHSGYSVLNTRIRFYALVFNPSIFSYQLTDSSFISGEARFPGKLGLSDKAYFMVKSLIDNLIEEFSSKKPAFEISIKAYLNLLLACIIREFPQKQSSRERLTASKNMEVFESLISFIQENYFERITVDQAAKIVNMSPFHFCKTFKRLTGRTFIEFINLYRINKAEDLLLSRNYSISEVAEKVGFCNINYFDKVFKKYKMYSPSKCK